MKNKTLVISTPKDGHLKTVLDEIQKLGGEPIVFFPENLGNELLITMDHFSSPKPITLDLFSEATNIDLRQLYSVWYRKPRPVDFSTQNITSKGAEFAQDEWRVTIESVYALMDHQLWVSHPDSLRLASRKPLQLAAAAEVGFAVPRTLITNDPQKARAFFQECGGKVVVKPVGVGWLYSKDETEILHFFTNRLNITDLDATQEIKTAPVLFQEEIPKVYEIRVNVVGQEVLAIKIESQRSKISELDWRRYDLENTPYIPYELPPDINSKCLKLTRKLGLEFGAIDLIRKPNNDYVFLEINGNGQFLWAENLSGVKVSQSLARLLVGVAPPLKLMSNNYA
jgi:glutathione synthase/RimK-type ligase-like ATP-grasp enzyme